MPHHGHTDPMMNKAKSNGLKKTSMKLLYIKKAMPKVIDVFWTMKNLRSINRILFFLISYPYLNQKDFKNIYWKENKKKNKKYIYLRAILINHRGGCLVSSCLVVYLEDVV